MKKEMTILQSIAAFLIVFSLNGLNAQQESHYINIANNPFIINPAASGLTDVMQLELTSRAQWIGYGNGPRTMILNGYVPVKIGNSGTERGEYNEEDKALFESPERSVGHIKHVLGGKAMHESIGPFLKTTIQGSYSIHLPFSKTLNISAGLGLGWSNLGIQEDRVVLFQTDDISYAQFLGNTSSQNILDANAGVTLYGKNLFLGVSTTQLLKNTAEFADVVTESNFNRHYFFIGKYRFQMGDVMSLEPSFVGKIVKNSPFSADVGIRANYKNSAWIGLQYRTSNAITAQIGANIIKNFHIAYGYEYATGPLRSASNGTHEIQIGFYLGKNSRSSNPSKLDSGEE